MRIALDMKDKRYYLRYKSYIKEVTGIELNK